MVSIETIELNIGIELKRKIEMICRFNNLKCEFMNGSIKNIKRINLAYVVPHQVIIDGQIHLFLDESKFIYIVTLDNMIPINELDNHLKSKR